MLHERLSSTCHSLSRSIVWSSAWPESECDIKMTWTVTLNLWNQGVCVSFVYNWASLNNVLMNHMRFYIHFAQRSCNLQIDLWVWRHTQFPATRMIRLYYWLDCGTCQATRLATHTDLLGQMWPQRGLHIFSVKLLFNCVWSYFNSTLIKIYNKTIKIKQ